MVEQAPWRVFAVFIIDRKPSHVSTWVSNTLSLELHEIVLGVALADIFHLTDRRLVYRTKGCEKRDVAAWQVHFR